MSQGLTSEMKSTIRRGLPVTVCGLKIYPILMTDYETFLLCKNALLVRLRSLPVEYMTRDYFSALFGLELDTLKKTGKGIGLVSRFLKLLELSLRIESLNTQKEGSIRYRTLKDRVDIESIAVVQGDTEVLLKPSDLSHRIRPVIAALNGLELPDENENPELVLANEQKKQFESRNARELKSSIDDLISSVAYLSHCRETEIMEWSVREFEARKRAIDRDKHYTLYGQAEMGGMVKFKNGNPCPSWCYDALDESLGTKSLASIAVDGLQIKN